MDTDSRSSLSQREALRELKALLPSVSPVQAKQIHTSEPVNARMAHLPAVYTPPVRGVKGIKRITMKHRRMVAMHVQGVPHVEIARTLGCAAATVSVVLNNPTIRAVLSRIHAEFDNYIMDLKPLVHEALRDSLSKGSRAEKMKAIDRWGRITGEFKDAPAQDQSAEDVIQRALKIRHTGADGSVTEVSYGEAKVS